jgi:DUF1009 family protein
MILKMMEFVLQRMSPSTKQRMIKMKIKQQQLSVDIPTIWTPSTHSMFPVKFRQVVKERGKMEFLITLKLTFTNYPKMFSL